MKKFILIVTLLGYSYINAQAYSGKGDVKFQIGANLQQNGTGIMGSLDFGLGENISVGFTSSYLLSVFEVYDPIEMKDVPGANFEDRFDFKARLNANIGNVINLTENLDVYPGLHLSLKNFGGHVGMRYFFTSGFGVFSELNFPIAKYNTETLTTAEKLNNQVAVSIGASFDI
jgi:hypothetical protein